MEFNLRTDESGATVACSSCGCEVPTDDFRGVGSDEPRRALCEFCAATMAGTFTQYVTGDEYTALRAEIWKAAACVFNMLKTPNV